MDKPFGNKQDSSKNEVKDETSQIGKFNIDTSQTSEKFLHLANEILEFLITKLQEINSLEQEIYERRESLKKQDESNQFQPEEEELWAEYKKRRSEITNPISLNQFDTSVSSIGKPTKYEYLEYPDTQIYFIMKSENRAVVEIFYEYGIKQKDQFVLKKEGDNWKIDTKKYGFSGKTWNKDEL